MTNAPDPVQGEKARLEIQEEWNQDRRLWMDAGMSRLMLANGSGAVAAAAFIGTVSDPGPVPAAAYVSIAAFFAGLSLPIIWPLLRFAEAEKTIASMKANKEAYQTKSMHDWPVKERPPTRDQIRWTGRLNKFSCIAFAIGTIFGGIALGS